MVFCNIIGIFCIFVALYEFTIITIMRKNYLITFILCFMSITLIGAKQPSRTNHKEKVGVGSVQRIKSMSQDATAAVVLTEDFSKFIAGSEATPDAVDLTDAETGEIAASYTNLDGWSGWGVYQAGGKAYMGWVKYSEIDAEWEDGPGYIATPLFDASTASAGFTIKFKARSKSATGDVLAVYWNWYDETLDDFDYDGVEDLAITNQWAEYTVQTNFGSAETFIDIYGTNSEFFIDDVEISVEGGGTIPPNGNVVFLETFGTSAPTSNPRAKINEYSGYDNISPVTYTYTTTDYADLRATSSLNSHVWFPANKETDLVISNIPTSGFSNMKLSFDVATNATSSNLNKVIVEVNDVTIQVPSVNITAQNTYVNSGDISLNDANVTKLRFYYTIANNPANFGYRLDNVKITGENASGLINIEDAKIYVSNGQLYITQSSSETIEIYQISGVLVNKYPAYTSMISLNTFNKGVYLVKIGAKILKVLF